MTANGNTTSLALFYCYARKDQKLRDDLDAHLTALRYSHSLITWYDGELVPGEAWEQVIEQHLNEADIILLLISPDFMRSEYCYSKEMRRAIDRHTAGTASVVPILLRPVDFDGAPFASIQMLPSSAVAVTSWTNQDEALKDVARGLRRTIADLLVKRGLLDGASFVFDMSEKNLEIPKPALEQTQKATNLPPLERVIPFIEGENEPDIILDEDISLSPLFFDADEASYDTPPTRRYTVRRATSPNLRNLPLLPKEDDEDDYDSPTRMNDVPPMRYTIGRRATSPRFPDRRSTISRYPNNEDYASPTSINDAPPMRYTTGRRATSSRFSDNEDYDSPTRVPPLYRYTGRRASDPNSNENQVPLSRRASRVYLTPPSQTSSLNSRSSGTTRPINSSFTRQSPRLNLYSPPHPPTKKSRSFNRSWQKIPLFALLICGFLWMLFANPPIVNHPINQSTTITVSSSNTAIPHIITRNNHSSKLPPGSEGFNFLDVLWWVVAGFVASFLASVISIIIFNGYYASLPDVLFIHLVFGELGSLLGGFLANVFHLGSTTGNSLWTTIAAFIGACVFILLFHIWAKIIRMHNVSKRSYTNS